MNSIPHLKSGDLIYLCSPAKQIPTELISHAQKVIEKLGFKVMIGANASGSFGYFSGTKDARLQDLQKGLDHPEVKAILCLRGGFGIIHHLDLLDWTFFKKHPKWICGFSDVTHLHLELEKMSFPGLHCTMPLNFRENTEQSISTLFEQLEGNPMSYSLAPNTNNRFGNCVGKICGGNLSILHSHLHRLESTFFDGKILFLEEVGEHLYKIDRMINVLKQFGAFEKISGLLLGSFTEISGSKESYGYSLDEILLSDLRDIPVLVGFPAGHQDDNQSLIFGVKTSLKVDDTGGYLQSV